MFRFLFMFSYSTYSVINYYLQLANFLKGKCKYMMNAFFIFVNVNIKQQRSRVFCSTFNSEELCRASKEEYGDSDFEMGVDR